MTEWAFKSHCVECVVWAVASNEDTEIVICVFFQEIV